MGLFGWRDQHAMASIPSLSIPYADDNLDTSEDWNKKSPCALLIQARRCHLIHQELTIRFYLFGMCLYPVVAMATTPGVTRRKQQRSGTAPNDNTMHVTTARSSADLTKPNQTQAGTPSQRTQQSYKYPHPQPHQVNASVRTQECCRMHPVYRRVTSQYLHTQSIKTRRKVWTQRQARNPQGIGIAVEQV